VSKRDYTMSLETAHRHALENNTKHLQAAQMLEMKMNIRERWRPGGLEWQAAVEKVVMWCYQHCIDILEGLVVAWMFELTKMNMSQTGMSQNSHQHCKLNSIAGYSLRKHITNALKVQSQAL
jgi:hypothetical protein